MNEYKKPCSARSDFSKSGHIFVDDDVIKRFGIINFSKSKDIHDKNIHIPFRFLIPN